MRLWEPTQTCGAAPSAGLGESVSSELATVIDQDEWNARLEMREALDDIAMRYHLGKYAQPRRRRVVRRRPSAKIIDMQEWLAAHGRGPERRVVRRPRTTGDSCDE